MVIPFIASKHSRTSGRLISLSLTDDNSFLNCLLKCISMLLVGEEKKSVLTLIDAQPHLRVRDVGLTTKRVYLLGIDCVHGHLVVKARRRDHYSGSISDVGSSLFMFAQVFQTE